jgi:hypothetical protein
MCLTVCILFFTARVLLCIRLQITGSILTVFIQEWYTVEMSFLLGYLLIPLKNDLVATKADYKNRQQ